MDTLEAIWNELGQKLGASIRRRISDPAAVEDITQDVLVKIQSNLGVLPVGKKLHAWVFRTARNAIVDHYRKTAVRGYVDLDGMELAAAATSDGAGAVAEQLAPCLMRMVGQLPPSYREAMELSDLGGLSQQELADRLGLSLSGAKSRVQRARAELRSMLLDCCTVSRDARGNVVDFDRTSRAAKYCGDSGHQPPCGKLS